MRWSKLYIFENPVSQIKRVIQRDSTVILQIVHALDAYHDSEKNLQIIT